VALKIALVILHADASRGGAERYTVDLAAGLASRGHEVSVLASSFVAGLDDVERVMIRARGVTRAARYRHFLKNLDRQIAQSRYDIVHAMLPVHRCDLYHPHAGIAAEALDRPSIHFNPRRRVMARVERELLGGAKPPVVLCLSNYIKGFVTKHYPLGPDRLETLFNAVDLERFTPIHAATEQPTALMIANDFERKGLETALRAVALVGAERMRLEVVGNEPAGRFATLANTLGLSDAVRFVGPSSDPRARYAAADFFVLPTKHDPCSLVVLEALAMGVPVISTRFNGACEIMTDGVHGFVLNEPSDADALAEAMRKMLDPERRAAMSRACVELRPKLSYEHHLDQVEEIYRRVSA
jgi:UDP-glucose:(heptosyl)LPS alpha-1,3-glucosyltransferase